MQSVTESSHRPGLRLPELFCVVLCTTIVLNYMHTHMSSSYR